MKNSLSKETQLIKPAELIFAFIMILIIAVGFKSQNDEINNSKIEETSQQYLVQSNLAISEFQTEPLPVKSEIPIPFLIILLLLVSYGVLNYTMILVQEIKK